MPDLVALLAPLGAVDHRVPSRPGVFSPVGVMIHHTASRIRQDPFPSLHICKVGRSDLPGPLCNVLIGRNAGIAVITDGRANDSGGGDPDVLAAIRNFRPLPAPNDTTTHRVDGNAWFYDVEVENDGVGEEYHPRVLAATGAVVAAICRHHGWGVERVLRHKDWTRRKIDWSWDGDYRALVADYLEDDMPTSEEIAEAVIQRLNTEGTAVGLQGFGATVQHVVELGRRVDVRTTQILSLVSDPAALAEAIVEKLPAGSVGASTVEAALRKVFADAAED